MHRSTWLLAAVVAVAVVYLAAAALARAGTFFAVNSTPIMINDGTCFTTRGGGQPPSWGATRASPYPSQIFVLSPGTITDVNVTLHGLSTGDPDDLAVLLLGPPALGRSTLLMADVGGNIGFFGGTTSPVDLTFDDAAAKSIADTPSPGSIPPSDLFPDERIVSGSYKPSVGARTLGCFKPISFPLPEMGGFPLPPAGPYQSSLSVFNGFGGSGFWSLYVIDDTSSGALGSISGGWSLEITDNTPSARRDPAVAMLTELHDQVTGFGLPNGLASALNSQLDAARDARVADHTSAACGQLKAFLNLVDAQTGKELTAEQARFLTAGANLIRPQLDC